MDPFCYFSFVFFCHSVLSVPYSLVATCGERTDVYALLFVMFLLFLSLSHMMSWVRCGTHCIVLIPDFCLLPCLNQFYRPIFT